MRSFLSIITVLLVIGCVHPDAGSIAGTGSAAIDSISANITAADLNIDAATPHSDTFGQSRLKTAKTFTAAATADLPKVQDSLDSLRKLSDQQAKTISYQDSCYVGPATKRLAWWIVGIGAAFGIILIILQVAAGAASGGSEKIILGIFHFLTGGIFWIIGKIKTVSYNAGLKLGDYPPVVTPPAKPAA